MARVLLVEDHEQLHRVLCDIIKEAGHDADCVKTKAEAVRLLNPGSHMLVVADVVLPDGSGHDVAAVANELGINTIVMSGHPSEIQTMIISNVVHLSKPFRLEEFEQLLEQHIKS